MSFPESPGFAPIQAYREQFGVSVDQMAGAGKVAANTGQTHKLLADLKVALDKGEAIPDFSSYVRELWNSSQQTALKVSTATG